LLFLGLVSFPLSNAAEARCAKQLQFKLPHDNSTLCDHLFLAEKLQIFLPRQATD
jgi:hypothetical protein